MFFREAAFFLVARPLREGGGGTGRATKKKDFRFKANQNDKNVATKIEEGGD